MNAYGKSAFSTKLIVFSIIFCLCGCGGGISAPPQGVDSPPSMVIRSVSGSGKRIAVYYDLTDPDGDRCSIAVEYFDKDNWKSACSSYTTSITPGTNKLLYWNSGADEFFLPSGMTTSLRLTPFNSLTGDSKETEPFFFSTTGLTRTNLWTGTSEALGWTLGDMDNDGDLDGILIPSSVTVAPCEISENSGDGTFSRSDISTATPLSYGSGTWGDYDGDGDVDILTMGQSGNKLTTLLENTGSGTFTDSTLPFEGRSQGNSVFRDINNDGFLDILTCGYNIHSFDLLYYLNTGVGGFAEPEIIINDIASNAAFAAGDLNNDGTIDVAVSTDSTTIILINDGTGTFTSSQTINEAPEQGNIALSDVDCDGDLDLGICGRTNRGATVHLNSGNGQFSETGGTTPFNGNGQITFGDITGDGYPDMVVCGENSGTVSTWLYTNTRMGSFVLSNQGTQGMSKASISIGDLDQDNDLDIITSGSTGSSWASERYLNDSAPANGMPQQPPHMETEISGTGPYEVTFFWEDAIDRETPSKGLSYTLRIGTSSNSHSICPGHHLTDGTRILSERGSIQPQQSGINWHRITLPAGIYYWTIQTIDASFEGSAVIDERVLTVP